MRSDSTRPSRPGEGLSILGLRPRSGRLEGTVPVTKWWDTPAPGGRAAEPCPCLFCSGEPEGTPLPQRGVLALWDPKPRQNGEAHPQSQGKGMGGPDQHSPGQATPLLHRTVLRGKTQKGLHSQLDGTAGTFLSSEVGDGVKGHGSPVHPRPMRLALAWGSRGQRNNPPLEGP